MGAMDKLGDMAGEHGDKVEQISDQGLDRAGDMADERTGGGHADQIDKAQDAADARLGEEQETQSPT
jgi:hypothetical protein